MTMGLFKQLLQGRMNKYMNKLLKWQCDEYCGVGVDVTQCGWVRIQKPGILLNLIILYILYYFINLFNVICS